MGAKLFWHAITMLMRNIKQAIFASFIPVCIYVAVAVAGAVVLPGNGIQDPGSALFLALGVFALAGFLFSWVAVTWHRYVLLEEEPALFPRTSGLPIWPYFGNTIKLALWLVLLLIPLLIMLGLVAAPFMDGTGTIGRGAVNYGADDVLFELTFGAFFGFIWLRYAMILPACAVGNQMSLKESRLHTVPFRSHILVVTFLIALTNVLLGALIVMVGSGGTIVSEFIGLVVLWFTTMLGIVILTTLYGHIIEGRALPD